MWENTKALPWGGEVMDDEIRGMEMKGQQRKKKKINKLKINSSQKALCAKLVRVAFVKLRAGIRMQPN